MYDPSCQSLVLIQCPTCVCGARSRLPDTPGLLPLHFPALSPSCRRKCSGPRVDPPHPSYSNSLSTACQLPLPPSILAAACPLAIFVLHFYIVFIACGARCVWSITPRTWRLVLACLGLSSPCSPSLYLSPSQLFLVSFQHSLYTWYLCLCLAFAAKLAIVQLQRHS